MDALYDQIGNDYTATRCTDPKIAKQINRELHDATKVLNVGAGTGSYEPEHLNLVAVEPSIAMIEQRQVGGHPVKRAFADKLPFADKSFSHTMTILSMHHWSNRRQAFEEIKRVTTDKFIAVTWFPDLAPFWLVDKYFPELQELDRQIFPSIKELETAFGSIEVSPMLIPEDCQDGFLACYWKRPEAYLNDQVRAAMSSFGKIRYLERGLAALRSDLKSGRWHKENALLLQQTFLDTGYRIVTVDLTGA